MKRWRDWPSFFVTYEKFGKLRLKQFAPPNAEVGEIDGWEWMGGCWINEGIGFTRMSRHEDTPDETGGLEVDLSEFPESAALAVFDAIDLPLRRGMTLQEVQTVLGKAEQTNVFIADRKSYNLAVGSRHPYYVSATIHNEDGLIHVAVIRKDVLARCDA